MVSDSYEIINANNSKCGKRADLTTVSIIGSSQLLTVGNRVRFWRRRKQTIKKVCSLENLSKGRSHEVSCCSKSIGKSQSFGVERRRSLAKVPI